MKKAMIQILRLGENVKEYPDIVGCEVESLGDSWMIRGSKGIVLAQAGSRALVRWTNVTVEKLIGTKSTHELETLAPSDSTDPNVIFRLKRR